MAYDVSILLTRRLLTIHKVTRHDDKMLDSIASCHHTGLKPNLSLIRQRKFGVDSLILTKILNEINNKIWKKISQEILHFCARLEILQKHDCTIYSSNKLGK